MQPRLFRPHRPRLEKAACDDLQAVCDTVLMPSDDARNGILTERRPGHLATSKFVPMIVGLLSSFGPKEAVDRLEAEIQAESMTVFARIDHAAGAAEGRLPLRPTELLIFGSAKAGTSLMQANQAIGIDLSLNALVLEDAAGKVWFSNS